MSEESVIPAALKTMVGVELEPTMAEVEKGHVKRFAEAIGDPNPLYRDMEYASKSRYSGIIAPPTFFQDLGLTKIVPQLLAIKCPLPRHLYAGVEMEFHKPMKSGDVITARSKLADVIEKEGKEGKLLFMIIEATYTNQNGELVAIGRHNFVRL